MSDPKRATLITVGAPKSAKNSVNKTVRLTVNLDESNESKYPELNYKALLITTARKKRVENGKTSGLDPFSDNDDDVERVARKFEQKYGGKSTYGRKGRSKYDEFADIGAGYDDNDSFIDNTHGYDEMIPPECDTLYGGFYINCGSLEFKTVPENQSTVSDGDQNRRNKRRISSSSSEEESSESSSESDSQEAKDPKAIANGELDSHKTEHRKKKNKNIDKKKAKKVRRTDSSAATSGKQTSDDNVQGDAESADSRTSQSDSLTSKPAPSSENAITSDSSSDRPQLVFTAETKFLLRTSVSKLKPKLLVMFLVSRQEKGSNDTFDNVQGDAESADSRTSQSDSLTSKPAPSSENAITSDSSRDVEAKVEVKLPSPVQEILEELDILVQQARDNPTDTAKADQCVVRLNLALSKGGVDSAMRRAAWHRAAKTMHMSRVKLLQRVKDLKSEIIAECDAMSTPTPNLETAQSLASVSISTNTTSTAPKRKAEDALKPLDVSRLTPDEKEVEISNTLERLKVLIDERTPGMMAAYNAECERVQEKRKKIQIASAVEGAPHIDKRLPKRRFPWCPRARALLARLAALAGDPESAATLLATRALKLFPSGFVRMPTLLRQADLSKEIKASDIKRQRLGSASQAVIASTQQFNEPIQFPSSLTVTTSVKNIDENDKDKYKINPAAVFGTVLNSYSLSQDIVMEKEDRKKDPELCKDDNMYIPPNIGSITITPVPNQKEKKVNNVNDRPKEPLLRVKSPAVLNEMVTNRKAKDKEKHKKTDKDKDHKRIDTPLTIDTTNPSKKEPEKSPKSKDEFSKKQIESMRIAENNIPRPGLVSVHHSPTFAKPDKRPPEVKKKKDIVIVSDLDPLSDIPQEPVAIDDSSSDVEVIEEKSADKSEPISEKSDIVPLKDRSDKSDNHKTMKNNVKVRIEKSVSSKEFRKKTDESTKEEIDSLMRDISEMKHSQEPTALNCNSYGGVITSAQNELL
ncbi:jg2305 [Pararge aegeria aegeria]|uniref:Jg2305 protein n=4 Tax=Pararge aegeria TaxID=116150 RepID=A0A8S4S5S3_9NEOP|nr:jg2305 [Pararge aegeria aegeria]